MVKFKTITKVIEEYVKCPAAKPAQNIGKTGSWTSDTTDYGSKDERVTYDDGT